MLFMGLNTKDFAAESEIARRGEFLSLSLCVAGHKLLRQTTKRQTRIMLRAFIIK